MNANDIILWTLAAGLIPSLIIAIRARAAGWIGVLSGILVVTGATWVLRPDVAGYAGGALWVVLVGAPALAGRWLSRLVGHQRYRTALDLYTAIGNRLGQANASRSLGNLDPAVGKPDAARPVGRE